MLAYDSIDLAKLSPARYILLLLLRRPNIVMICIYKCRLCLLRFSGRYDNRDESQPQREQK